MLQQTRVNDAIRISPVRLIDPEGNQVGVVPVEIARQRARQHDLDLVEVAPAARPPVCRIMDWSKHRYDKQKAARRARQRQSVVTTKELKFRPRTDEHDLEVKLRRAREFLEKANKVKVTVRYRGAELRHPENGIALLDEVVARLADIGSVEGPRNGIEGRAISRVLAPRPGAGGGSA